MKRACVAGHHISHTRSPIIHNYWIRKYGLEAEYTVCDISADKLPELVAKIRDGSLQGCNVTVPHKQAIIPLLDDIDEAAQHTGSVNTVYMADGRIAGTSTDGAGFVSHLLSRHPDFQTSNSQVVILGAGGAARSLAGAFAAAGAARIVISNRTLDKAEDVAALAPQTSEVMEIKNLSVAARDADIVINTTSLGTAGHGQFPFPIAETNTRCIISDIVYVPLKTPFLASAATLGRPTLDGLGMLLHQAVRGFELWFGIRPEVTEELRALVEQDIVTSG